VVWKQINEEPVIANGTIDLAANTRSMTLPPSLADRTLYFAVYFVADSNWLQREINASVMVKKVKNYLPKSAV
jgi:hypothetical protein